MANHTRLRNVVAYVETFRALTEAAHTAQELQRISGLGERTTKNILRSMHRRGMVYVAVWRADRCGRHNTPAWKFGQQPDVPKPLPLSAAARTRAYRSRRDE